MSRLATIEGDEIVIRIKIDVLPTAVQQVPGWPESWRVSDMREAAQSVVRRLNDEEEDGTTLVHRALDQAALDALEGGDEGFDEFNLNEQDED